jgi:acetylornithine/N-succinyldiaminopimelate aminotransferase
MNDPEDTRERLESRHFPMYRRYPLTLVEGRGARVRDHEGREYIDALGGIAVNAVGHCHPAVVAAITDQAGRLIHASNLYHMVPQAELAERLTDAVGLDRVFFVNSGTEAVEGALKLARRHARAQGRGTGVISFAGCFHGRTVGALSAHTAAQREPFEPLLEGYQQLPLGDLGAIESALSDEIAAVIIEPVQGEGGVRVVPDEFLRDLRRLCDRSGALLICDEIQCGIGRTGRFNACDHAGIKPDIMVLAKALGGGMPIGAVLATDTVARAFAPGDHGTTFGGNPLACAAAVATLGVIEDEALVDRAAVLGNHLLTRLRDSAGDHAAIREVRGRGLMVGVELDFPARDLVTAMMDAGVLANATAETVVRFLPPLNIPEPDLDRVVDVFLSCLESAVTERSGS